MADEGFLENLKQGDIAGLGRNIAEGARDEWLGIDDFGRMVKYAGRGDFLKALKSLGAGTLELGGTALMFVPGGQLAALSKVPALGKAAKGLQMLKPLTLPERLAARGAQGARSFRKAAPVRDVAELIGKEIALPADRSAFRRLLSSATDEFGYGRGGVLGSVLRGLGQATGQFPAAQGPLAAGMLGGRIRAPFLSGKLGPLAMRTGIDTQIMEPFMGETPTNPQLDALMQFYGYSPGAA